MKIIILGAGQVGSSLGHLLSQEPNNEITLIDTDEERLESIRHRADVTTVLGNASHASVLEKAQVRETDILIACTHYDEINLLACDISKRLFGVAYCIARLRSNEYGDYLRHRMLQEGAAFAIDSIIQPEQLITEHFKQLIIHPDALQVMQFAEGRISLVAVTAEKGGSMIDLTLKSLSEDLIKKDLATRMVALYRDGQALEKLSGDTVIKKGDEVFFLAPSNHIEDVMEEIRPIRRKPYERVAIAGGGNIGLQLARSLEKLPGIKQVKIIEEKSSRCQYLAKELSSSIVLHGNACESDLLRSENISSYDVFCSVTNDDENNIMSSMLARKLGVKKAIALVTNNAYVELIEGDKIDVLVSPSAITTSALLRHIRGSDVILVHSLRQGLAEAIEVVVNRDDKGHSNVLGKTFSEINLPKSVSVGAMVHDGIVYLSSKKIDKELRIQEGDHVVLFLTNKEAIPEVARLFSIHP